MKQEIDALQIEAMKERGPWYKRLGVVIPVVVSLAAFLLALTTTLLGESRLRQEQEHADRVELRQLIQRLVALPREDLELTQKYSDKPDLLGRVAGAVNTENRVLATQALELISELDGDVTATEYFAVAGALAQGSLTREQEALVEQGIDETEPHAGDDVQGYLDLLRARASLAYTLGKVEQGRQYYSRALGTFESSEEDNPYVVANTRSFTEYSWAGAEYRAGNCAAAKGHIRAAASYRSQTTIQLLLSAVPTLAEQIQSGCGSTTPAEPESSISPENGSSP